MLRGLAVLGPRRYPVGCPIPPHHPRGPVTTETLQHVALFDTCKSFTKAREPQAVGLYPYYRPITHSEDTVLVIEGTERIMMGPDNSPALTDHLDALPAAQP